MPKDAMGHHWCMPTSPNARSVRISDDERGGWSSDRPRRDGAPRPVDVSTRCRVLRPSDTLRYSPGSLLVVVSPSKAERDRFLDRTLESQGPVLSLDKVRALIEGRVASEEVDERAAQLLDATAQKRFEAGDSVVLAANGLDAGERERFVRMAHRLRRPRHVILLDAPRDQVADDDRASLNDLRRRLDAGELGLEGFQTAVRLGGQTTAEVKRVVFRPPPQDD
jgi:predicted kinase